MTLHTDQTSDKDYTTDLDLELEFEQFEGGPDADLDEEPTPEEVVAQAQQFLGRQSRRTHRRTVRQTDRAQRREIKALEREVKREARKLRRAGKDEEAEKLEADFDERVKALEAQHDQQDAEISAPLQFLLELSERPDAQAVVTRLDSDGTFSELLELIGYENLWKDPNSIKVLPALFKLRSPDARLADIEKLLESNFFGDLLTLITEFSADNVGLDRYEARLAWELILTLEGPDRERFLGDRRKLSKEDAESQARDLLHEALRARFITEAELDQYLTTRDGKKELREVRKLITDKPDVERAAWLELRQERAQMDFEAFEDWLEGDEGKAIWAQRLMKTTEDAAEKRVREGFDPTSGQTFEQYLASPAGQSALSQARGEMQEFNAFEANNDDWKENKDIYKAVDRIEKNLSTEYLQSGRSDAFQETEQNTSPIIAQLSDASVWGNPTRLSSLLTMAIHAGVANHPELTPRVRDYWAASEDNQTLLQGMGFESDGTYNDLIRDVHASSYLQRIVQTVKLAYGALTGIFKGEFELDIANAQGALTEFAGVRLDEELLSELDEGRKLTLLGRLLGAAPGVAEKAAQMLLDHLSAGTDDILLMLIHGGVDGGIMLRDAIEQGRFGENSTADGQQSFMSEDEEAEHLGQALYADNADGSKQLAIPLVPIAAFTAMGQDTTKFGPSTVTGIQVELKSATLGDSRRHAKAKITSVDLNDLVMTDTDETTGQQSMMVVKNIRLDDLHLLIDIEDDRPETFTRRLLHVIKEVAIKLAYQLPKVVGGAIGVPVVSQLASLITAVGVWAGDNAEMGVDGNKLRNGTVGMDAIEFGFSGINVSGITTSGGDHIDSISIGETDLSGAGYLSMGSDPALIEKELEKITKKREKLERRVEDYAEKDPATGLYKPKEGANLRRRQAENIETLNWHIAREHALSIGTHQAQISQYRGAKADFQTEIDEIDEKIAFYEGQGGDSARVEELKARRGELEAQIADMDAQIDAEKARMSQLEGAGLDITVNLGEVKVEGVSWAGTHLESFESSGVNLQTNVTDGGAAADGMKIDINADGSETNISVRGLRMENASPEQIVQQRISELEHARTALLGSDNYDPELMAGYDAQLTRYVALKDSSELAKLKGKYTEMLATRDELQAAKATLQSGQDSMDQAQIRAQLEKIESLEAKLQELVTFYEEEIVALGLDFSGKDFLVLDDLDLTIGQGSIETTRGGELAVNLGDITVNDLRMLLPSMGITVETRGPLTLKGMSVDMDLNNMSIIPRIHADSMVASEGLQFLYADMDVSVLFGSYLPEGQQTGEQPCVSIQNFTMTNLNMETGYEFDLNLGETELHDMQVQYGKEMFLNAKEFTAETLTIGSELTDLGRQQADEDALQKGKLDDEGNPSPDLLANFYAIEGAGLRMDEFEFVTISGSEAADVAIEREIRRVEEALASDRDIDRKELRKKLAELEEQRAELAEKKVRYRELSEKVANGEELSGREDEEFKSLQVLFKPGDAITRANMSTPEGGEGAEFKFDYDMATGDYNFTDIVVPSMHLNSVFYTGGGMQVDIASGQFDNIRLSGKGRAVDQEVLDAEQAETGEVPITLQIDSLEMDNASIAGLDFVYGDVDLSLPEARIADLELTNYKLDTNELELKTGNIHAELGSALDGTLLSGEINAEGLNFSSILAKNEGGGHVEGTDMYGDAEYYPIYTFGMQSLNADLKTEFGDANITDLDVGNVTFDSAKQEYSYTDVTLESVGVTGVHYEDGGMEFGVGEATLEQVSISGSGKLGEGEHIIDEFRVPVFDARDFVFKWEEKGVDVTLDHAYLNNLVLQDFNSKHTTFTLDVGPTGISGVHAKIDELKEYFGSNPINGGMSLQSLHLGGAYNQDGELVYSADVQGLAGDIDFEAAPGEASLVRQLAFDLQETGASITYNKTTDVLGFDVDLGDIAMQSNLDWSAASFVSRTGKGAWPHSTTGADLKGFTAKGEVRNMNTEGKELEVFIEGLHVDLLEAYDDNKAADPANPGKSNRVSVNDVDVVGLEVIGGKPMAGTIDVGSISAEGDTDRGSLRAFQDKLKGFGIDQGAASLNADTIFFSFEDGTTHGRLETLKLTDAEVDFNDPAVGQIEGTLPEVMLRGVRFNYTDYEQYKESLPEGESDDHWYEMDLGVDSLELTRDATVQYTTASKYQISPERLDEVEEALTQAQAANNSDGPIADVKRLYYDLAFQQLQDVRTGAVAYTPVTTQQLWHFERTMAADQQFDDKRRDRAAHADDRKETLENIVINGRSYDLESANKMDILTKELGLNGLFKIDLAAGAASDMDLVNYEIEALINEKGLLTSVRPDYQEIFDDVKADFKEASNQGFWSGLWTGIKSIVSAGASTVASTLTAPVINDLALVFDMLFTLIPGVRKWVGNQAWDAAGGDGLVGVDPATADDRATMRKDALAEQTGTYTGMGEYFAITDGSVTLNTKPTTISFVSNKQNEDGGSSTIETSTTLPGISFHLDQMTLDNDVLRLSGMGAKFGSVQFDRDSSTTVNQTSGSGLQNTYLQETSESAGVGGANFIVSDVTGRTVAGANGEGLDQYDVTLAAGTNVRKIEYSREERTFGKVKFDPSEEFCLIDG